MSYKYQTGQKYESRNQNTMDDLTKQYNERGPFTFSDFSYNPNTDKAFQDYADIMRNNGNLAMKDTMAKAASMTGGYGNSYAQTAGQQMYNNYVDQIGLAEGQFYDRALSKYNAEYDRAFAKYNAEGNDLLTKLGLYQTQEAADRAAWESDFAAALTDAQNKATYAGDYSGLAAILGVDAGKLAENAKTAGLKDLSDEQINAYKEALKQGNGEGYYDELRILGYDTGDLYSLRDQWEASGEIANVIEKGSVPGGKTWGQYRDTVNSSIKGLNNTKKGQNFHVKGKDGEDNYDVQIGTEITDANDPIKQYVDETKRVGKTAQGLIVFDGSLYYADGDGGIFTVDDRETGDLDRLIKLIQGG